MYQPSTRLIDLTKIKPPVSISFIQETMRQIGSWQATTQTKLDSYSQLYKVILDSLESGFAIPTFGAKLLVSVDLSHLTLDSTNSDVSGKVCQ